MAKYMGSKGSTAGAWMFFPTLGAGKVEFDYFLVLSYKNYKALGHDQEVFANGGGWQKHLELTGGKVSCDVPRVYSAELVRSAGPGESFGLALKAVGLAFYSDHLRSKAIFDIMSKITILKRRLLKAHFCAANQVDRRSISCNIWRLSIIQKATMMWIGRP